MSVSRTQRTPWALGGVLFVVLFICGLILGGVLSSASFPMPGAPAPEIARYFDENRTAVVVSGSLQVLSAVSLFIFTFHVSGFMRRTGNVRDALPGITLAGGAVAAGSLLVSALLSLALIVVAAEGGSALIKTLRNLNFLTGGAVHVAMLGVFVGAASTSLSRSRAVPRWTALLGTVAAVLSLLSLASLIWFPATFLIPLGRLLAAVWIIAVSLFLVRSRPREEA